MTDTSALSAYIHKAETALSGARLLLNAGNADDACNRAYYAMFDAAHAALLALGAEAAGSPIKTHNGLVAKFGQHLVRGNYLAADHGEALNAVQRFRKIAGYSGESIRIEDAAWALERADALVVAVKAFLGRPL